MGRRVALGADDRGPLTDTLLAELARRDVAVETFGALRDGSTQWASMARSVAEEVASARADLGIVCCWTGTGVSIAANKVAGVRAALCGDAATAAGARRWNDANVLALSLRATSPALACEILAAFLDTSASDDPDDRREIAKLSPP
jgi:ribose 5-phosphate isomerase B